MQWNWQQYNQGKKCMLRACIMWKCYGYGSEEKKINWDTNEIFTTFRTQRQSFLINKIQTFAHDDNQKPTKKKKSKTKEIEKQCEWVTCAQFIYYLLRLRDQT